jgi:hypothetical protein
VTELATAHTADLDAHTRSAIRVLMDAAFGGVSDDTSENVLGGVHPRDLRSAGFVPVDVSGDLVCDWRPGSVW